MPFTFLSHQAPVLPLKIAAPRWFDGTALVVGSMAPDLAFVTHGTTWYVDAHTLAPQVWLCVPLTLALTWIIKRIVAAPLAAHLPDAGPFHLRDYGRLGTWRLPTHATGWVALITSALIGSLTHLMLDSFTHGFGWVVQNVNALQAQAFTLPSALTGRIVYVHDLLQLGGTAIGAAITIWCLYLIGQRRLVRHWYPTATTLQPTPTSRRRLTTACTLGLAAGLATAGTTAHIGGAQDLIIRIAAGTFLGIVAGCIAARPAMNPASESPLPTA